MADKKVTQLTDLGDGLAVDLFHVVDDQAEHQSTKKSQREDVFNNIPSW